MSISTKHQREVAELQVELRLLRRAVGTMWLAWMIKEQTESECDGMGNPGKACDPVELCKCKNSITLYVENAKKRMP